MRTFILLAFAGALCADETFDAAVVALTEVQDQTFEPGARARINPAVEQLAECDDPRVAGVLARYMAYTLAGERKAEEALKQIQAAGAAANDRILAIDKELLHLVVRLKAGAHEVGPRIEELKVTRTRQERIFANARAETDRLDRAVAFARGLRDRILVLGAGSLARLPKDRIETGLRGVRRALDVKRETQALLAVRMLRESRRVEAVPHIVDILNHPGISAGARRQAILALATHDDPRGIDALLKAWQRDPGGIGQHARYALSLVAKRPLKDMEDARAWAKEHRG